MDSNNSMLTEVRLLYAAIFLDLGKLHPTICAELEREFTRLLKAESACGLPFYTIALPDGHKWLDKSLSSGRLVEPRPPHFGVKGKGDKRPRFLWVLFSRIFEPDGTLQLALDPSYIQSLRQVMMACKKLDMECERKYTDESVTKFHEIEKSLPKPRIDSWNSNIPRWVHLTGHPIWGPAAELDRQACVPDVADTLLQLDEKFDWDGLRRFSARVLHSFGQFDPFAIEPKHGPGAVSDREAKYVKYDFRSWTNRLEPVFPYDYHANSGLSVPDYVVYKEYPSKMHAVPKTQSGPRLIAAEPTSHQWIQQGIRRWLEQRTKRSILAGCIDFTSQHLSRDMCLEASVSGDSATVDLSSASDRLSVRLVEFLFQHNRPLLDGLHASRTRAIESLNGEVLYLNKFASQGSAVIFPLQSIVYTILALWAVGLTRGQRHYEGIASLATSVRVFGDDIIVPSDAYPVLQGLLETLLLKVNDNKSHFHGFFRESCGMDAYKGVDVTPAYLRKFYSKTPENLSSVTEASNNFFKKGYWHTAKHLEKTVPEAERKLIPVGTGLGSVALFSYCGNCMDHLAKRWNDNYHIWEHRVITVDTRVDLRHGDGEGSLTQFFFEEPSPLLPYRSGQVSQVRSRKRTRWV
jgi:hypothetical protein